MKATLFDLSGKKIGDVTLPDFFGTKVREDIVLKYFEADKFIQPYSPFHRAGLRQAAAGKISHKRHDWKGHYGQGRSRMPRKTMWRRGTQFFWVGANVPATRGGRKAHPPKGIGVEKKINIREMDIAFNSAFASTAMQEYVSKRYVTLQGKIQVPAVIESLPQKTKEFIAMLKNIFGETFSLVMKQKTIRAGKGKLRGRKYKSNAGLLLVVGKEEKAKFNGVDIRTPIDLKIADLYPLGRLTLYTKKALQEMDEKK